MNSLIVKNMRHLTRSFNNCKTLSLSNQMRAVSPMTNLFYLRS